MKKIKKYLLVGLILLCLMSTTVNAVGLGVAPATLDFKQVLRNRPYTRYLSVQVPDVSETDIEISLNFVNYSQWIGIPEDIIIPAGQKEVKVPITLNVSRGTPLGNYGTKIEVRRSCEGSFFCVGVDSDMVFEVTKERVLGPMLEGNVLTQSIMAGDDFYVQGKLGCYGNLPCSFKVDIDTGVFTYSKRYSLDAYSSTYFTAVYKKTGGLPLGRYYANTKVYYKQNKIWNLLAEKSPSFSIISYKKRLTIGDQSVILTNYTTARKATRLLNTLGFFYTLEPVWV